MSDEPQRSAEVIPLPLQRTKGKTERKSEYENVEFLGPALEDPANVLRVKIKDIAELPDGIYANRVIVITETIGMEGRSLDIVWSDNEGESSYEQADSVVALLGRIHAALLHSED